MRVTIQHASGLAQRGHQVTLVFPAYACPDYLDLPDNLDLVPVQIGKSARRFLGYFATVFALGRAIPACDVVLANSWQCVYPALISQRCRSNKRIVLLLQHLDSVINLGRPWPVRWRNQVMFEYIYRLPIQKIVVSSWLQRTLKEQYKQTAICVPNGVDGAAFTGGRTPQWRPSIEHYDVLCLARAAKWKGFQDVVTAVRELAADDPRVRLVVATRDPLDLPADFPVVLVRPQNDMELGQLYQSCSVFVLSSWLEGFGLPALEAMACGVPVVTTDCGGVDDFARDGENCIVVPPRQPARLRCAIQSLKQDEGLARRVALSGHLTAQEFTLRKSTERMDAILKSM